MLENLQTNNGNLQTNIGWIKLNKQDKKQIIPSFGGMGHHSLAWRSTSLSLGNEGAMAQWEDGGEGVWVDLETNGLKESTQAT